MQQKPKLFLTGIVHRRLNEPHCTGLTQTHFTQHYFFSCSFAPVQRSLDHGLQGYHSSARYVSHPHCPSPASRRHCSCPASHPHSPSPASHRHCSCPASHPHLPLLPAIVIVPVLPVLWLLPGTRRSILSPLLYCSSSSSTILIAYHSLVSPSRPKQFLSSTLF